MDNHDFIQHRDLIVCDLEATCWNDPSRRGDMEIIEIGAVRLRAGEVVDEFNRCVCPVVNPILSDFCKELTTISQQEVDDAAMFPAVFAQFIDWVGKTPFAFCSWGAYDLRQFKLDVARHGLLWPVELDHHVNLKQAFTQWKNVRPCGMERALHLVKLPLQGVHHRGLDDARNIVRITRMMLPWLLTNEIKLRPVS